VWQPISYCSALAVESFVRVFGVRLDEEPRYDVVDASGIMSKYATTHLVWQPRRGL
jgi:hypothetical protein